MTDPAVSTPAALTAPQHDFFTLLFDGLDGVVCLDRIPCRG